MKTIKSKNHKTDDVPSWIVLNFKSSSNWEFKVDDYVIVKYHERKYPEVIKIQRAFISLMQMWFISENAISFFIREYVAY